MSLEANKLFKENFRDFLLYELLVLIRKLIKIDPAGWLLGGILTSYSELEIH